MNKSPKNYPAIQYLLMIVCWSLISVVSSKTDYVSLANGYTHPVTNGADVVNSSNTILATNGGDTNSQVACGLAVNSMQSAGHTNSAVELEPGVWGLIAGDADGDGKITEIDKAICNQQKGMRGYLSGDFNLDGKVE